MELPKDIWNITISLITDGVALARLAQTCKLFRDLISGHEQLWKIAFYNDFPEISERFDERDKNSSKWQHTYKLFHLGFHTRLRPPPFEKILKCTGCEEDIASFLGYMYCSVCNDRYCPSCFLKLVILPHSTIRNNQNIDINTPNNSHQKITECAFHQTMLTFPSEKLKYCFTTIPGYGFIVYLKTLSGKTTKVEHLSPTDKIERLAERIEEKEGIPPARQRLVYRGKRLNFMKTLEESGIEPGSVVHLVLALR